ncbi:MAG: cytochrome ubiquinol oxidase subunit I, partial [Bacteroidales bacterium]|nr:cytochrome ubiquinol oxidase subunit I [Bacteroidales bacterium]
IGIPNPNKVVGDDQEGMIWDIKIPKLLSFLATRDLNGYVPGINNIIDGGYPLLDGTTALSAEEKMVRGKIAHEAWNSYRMAKENNDQELMTMYNNVLKENMPYFGYAYIKDVKDLVPNVQLNFYAFRIMVILGGYFILFFVVMLILVFRKKLENIKWIQWVALLSIPFGYIAGMAGWVVAECGRQPWAIQDLMPVNAAISKLSVNSVQTTFFIFLALFTIMLIAEIGIMLKAIKKGPNLVTKQS